MLRRSTAFQFSAHFTSRLNCAAAAAAATASSSTATTTATLSTATSQFHDYLHQQPRQREKEEGTTTARGKGIRNNSEKEQEERCFFATPLIYESRFQNRDRQRVFGDDFDPTTSSGKSQKRKVQEEENENEQEEEIIERNILTDFSTLGLSSPTTNISSIKAAFRQRAFSTHPDQQQQQQQQEQQELSDSSSSSSDANAQFRNLRTALQNCIRFARNQQQREKNGQQQDDQDQQDDIELAKALKAKKTIFEQVKMREQKSKMKLFEHHLKTFTSTASSVFPLVSTKQQQDTSSDLFSLVEEKCELLSLSDLEAVAQLTKIYVECFSSSSSSASSYEFQRRLLNLYGLKQTEKVESIISRCCQKIQDEEQKKRTQSSSKMKKNNSKKKMVNNSASNNNNNKEVILSFLKQVFDKRVSLLKEEQNDEMEIVSERVIQLFLNGKTQKSNNNSNSKNKNDKKKGDFHIDLQSEHEIRKELASIFNSISSSSPLWSNNAIRTRKKTGGRGGDNNNNSSSSSSSSSDIPASQVALHLRVNGYSKFADALDQFCSNAHKDAFSRKDWMLDSTVRNLIDSCSATETVVGKEKEEGITKKKNMNNKKSKNNNSVVVVAAAAAEKHRKIFEECDEDDPLLSLSSLKKELRRIEKHSDENVFSDILERLPKRYDAYKSVPRLG